MLLLLLLVHHQRVEVCAGALVKVDNGLVELVGEEAGVSGTTRDPFGVGFAVRCEEQVGCLVRACGVAAHRLADGAA